MDPVLSWVVCGLSAFLLVAGGVLLARARSSQRLAAQMEHSRRLDASLREAMAQQQALVQENQRLNFALQEARDAEVALRKQRPAAPPPPDLGFEEDEQTALPDPVAFFGKDARRRGVTEGSVPRLKQVSDDEYEIPAAAPRSMDESEREGYADSHDATKQFKLHSPEAVVHFLQRIDELTEENRELRSRLEDQELAIKGHRAEGSEHLQRFAALDATADKLRQELKRRNARIKQLEDRLDQELRQGPPAAAPSRRPPSPLSKAVARSRARFDSAKTDPRLEAPTLQVQRYDEKELKKPGRGSDK